ncbi:type VII secretion target [Nocardia callitridis]|uniref:WXG100 family type VII secretion target n=1 Tax=Nocardia callitridis TaxID=648753 RepID=A0ABP9KR96_9NOCA
MAEQLNVEPAVLQAAADGINGIIEQLSEMGIKETGAVGRGFSLLALSPLEAGKGSVQKALETFTERWSWGVRTMVQTGNEIARTLNLAAGRYHEMDQISSNTLKEMYSHIAGNPHLSAQEIDGRSWGDTLSDNPVNQTLHPDYSAQSLADAQQHIDRNVQAIQAITPDVLANIGYPREWNTGAAEEAARIIQGEQAP